jgi:hypothetical protein
MKVNSLKFDSENLPTWQEIEPYIPNWFHDNGCSFPGPKWLWALLFRWKAFYLMSRICRVHDALYYLGQLEGWEFSWMDKEEMDYVLWEGIHCYGLEKRANVVEWGLEREVSEKIFDRLNDLGDALDLNNWANYVARKKQQLKIQEITGWE